MNIVYLLLPLATLLGLGFTVLFIFAAFRGQYDDLETPAHRLLIDPPESNSKERRSA